MIVRDAKVTRHFTGSPYTYWTQIRSTGSIWNPNLPGLPELASSNMINRATAKALEKLRAQDIHLGNFLATASETARTVANGLGHIAGTVRRFRRNIPERVWKLIKRLEGNLPRYRWCEIPSAWLEVQYGWKPIMEDIQGAIRHLSRESRYTVPYIEVKASAVEKSQFETDVACLAAYSVSGKVLWDRIVRCDVFLVYGITNVTLAELSSLGLINVAEIIWEVLPYSFVIDWAMPISSWLGALGATTGLEFITGGQSRTSKVKVAGSTVHFGNVFPEGTPEASPPPVKGRFFNFERSCYGSTPVPGIYVKNPFSATHVANAMSLLVEAFK